MPKLIRNALSAQMVRHAGPGSYVDGNGLMLRVRDSGSRSWTHNTIVHGRRVDIGLGKAELVSLEDARRIAVDNWSEARTCSGFTLGCALKSKSVLDDTETT